MSAQESVRDALGLMIDDSLPNPTATCVTSRAATVKSSEPAPDWNVPLAVWTARIVWGPTARLEVLKVEEAVSPLPIKSEPGPRRIEPSKNSTEPVGVPPKDVVSVTVAVNVAESPK